MKLRSPVLHPPPKSCQTQRGDREARCTCHASSLCDEASTLQAPGPWVCVSEELHLACHLFGKWDLRRLLVSVGERQAPRTGQAGWGGAGPTLVSVSGTHICADGISTKCSSRDKGTIHICMFISKMSSIRSRRCANRRWLSSGESVVCGAFWETSLRSCFEQEAKRIISFCFEQNTQPTLHGSHAG